MRAHPRLLALLAASSCGGGSPYLPDETGPSGCSIAIVPDRVGDDAVTGTVEQLSYRPDRDDVTGELATVEMRSGSGTRRALRFWADGRLPFETGDRLDVLIRCRAGGHALRRCDGTFRVDGQLALVIATSPTTELPDGWRAGIGRRLAVDEDGDRLVAERGVRVNSGDSSVEVGGRTACRRVRMAGATWLVSGSARTTEWKDERSHSSRGNDFFMLSIARARRPR